MTGLVHSVLRLFGKTYRPDPAVPTLYFMGLAFGRVVDLFRGFARTGHAVFVGPRVRLEGRGNIDFGRYVTLERDVTVNAILKRDMKLGHRVKIGAFTQIMGTAHLSRVGQYFVMGDNTGCGEFCYFGAAGGIAIGKNVVIGQYVSMHAQNHVFADPSKLICDQGTVEKGIIVGDDCWIGAKATILDGARIGHHSVVAAGAVVRGEFPPYSLLAGVPARVVRSLNETANAA